MDKIKDREMHNPAIKTEDRIKDRIRKVKYRYGKNTEHRWTQCSTMDLQRKKNTWEHCSKK